MTLTDPRAKHLDVVLDFSSACSKKSLEHFVLKCGKKGSLTHCRISFIDLRTLLLWKQK